MDAVSHSPISSLIFVLSFWQSLSSDSYESPGIAKSTTISSMDFTCILGEYLSNRSRNFLFINRYFHGSEARTETRGQIAFASPTRIPVAIPNNFASRDAVNASSGRGVRGYDNRFAP